MNNQQLQPTANLVEVKLIAKHNHAGVEYAPGTVLSVDQNTANLLVENWKIAEQYSPIKTPAAPASERDDQPQEDDAKTTGQLAASVEPPRPRLTSRGRTK